MMFLSYIFNLTVCRALMALWRRKVTTTTTWRLLVVPRKNYNKKKQPLKNPLKLIMKKMLSTSTYRDILKRNCNLSKYWLKANVEDFVGF